MKFIFEVFSRTFVFAVFLIGISFIHHKCSANEKIRVLDVDTGVDLSHKKISSHVKENTNSNNYRDLNGHGTSMAGLVLKNTCEEVELISCNYRDYSIFNFIDTTTNCFRRALNENIQYINYSSTGSLPSNDEREVLQKLSDKGVIITVAAGNNGKNLINKKTGKCDGSYPSCYLIKNVYIIQNINEYGYLHSTSNFISHVNARSEIGVNVPVLAPDNGTGIMTGTSPATAKHLNRLLLQRCEELKKKP